MITEHFVPKVDEKVRENRSFDNSPLYDDFS